MGFGANCRDIVNPEKLETGLRTISAGFLLHFSSGLRLLGFQFWAASKGLPGLEGDLRSCLCCLDNGVGVWG